MATNPRVEDCHFTREGPVFEFGAGAANGRPDGANRQVLRWLDINQSRGVSAVRANG
jgi:hypothetical protein